MEPSHTARNSYVFLVGSFLLISFLSLLLFFFYNNSITGNASAELDLFSSSQRRIEGIYTYTLENGDSLPFDSTTKVKLSINSYERERNLEDVLVDKSILAQKKNVNFNALVRVEIRLEPYQAQSNGQQVSSNGAQVPSPSQDQETDASANGAGSSGIQSGGGVKNPPFTAAVVSEGNDHLTVYLRQGEVISYPLSGARPVVEGVWRVRDNMHLENSNIRLTFTSKSFTITTSYLEQVTGFSFPSVTDVRVDLSKFAQPLLRPGLKNIKVTLKYGDEVINSQERSLVVSSGAASTSSQSSLTDNVLPSSDGEHHSERTIAPLVLSTTNVVCKNEFCGAFGPCSIPSLAQTTSKDFIALTPVMSQQCICQDNGESYTRARACDKPNDAYLVTSSSGSGGSHKIDWDNAQPHERTLVAHDPWKKSFVSDIQEVKIRGYLARELETNTRVVLTMGEESHSIGVVKFDKDRALIEGASIPEQAWIGEGEFSYFVAYNGQYNFKVSVIKVTNSGALIHIEPIQTDPLMEIGENERGVDIVDSQLNQPVARVIFNGELPSLDVILLQSPSLMPAHCSNSIKDQDELAVDCGGADCNQCRADKVNFLPLGLWLAVGGLALILIISRIRR
jgi:hypothetical protein